MDFFTNHTVSLHIGDKTMTIDHTGITKIPQIANDTGCSRVSKIIKIPASSIKNVRINNYNTYMRIKVINPYVNQITLPLGFTIYDSSIVEDSDIVQLYDNVKQEREVNDLSGGETTQKSTKTKTPIKFDFTESALNSRQKRKLSEFLNKNRNVFVTNLGDIGHTKRIKHEIITGDAPPATCRPYRTTPQLRTEIDRQLDEMLEYGIVEESLSSYCSPVVMMKRKKNEYRLWVDNRKLNAETISQNHPTPRLDDIIDLLAQSNRNIYSTLDLFSGYLQCEIHENSRHKTAFATRNRHVQFRRLPFGLKNSPSFFILMGNKVLKGLTSKLCSIYIDDIIVWSNTFDEHFSQIFDRLRAANLKLKPSKCNFAKSDVLLLGHIISGQGVNVNPEKVEVVKSIPLLKNQHDVRAFLSPTNCYRKHV